MMIQAVLGNPNHPEYGVATIPFPIPRDQYAHCMELLEALEIGDAVKADCKVEEVDTSGSPTQLLSSTSEIASSVFVKKNPPCCWQVRIWKTSIKRVFAR